MLYHYFKINNMVNHRFLNISNISFYDPHVNAILTCRAKDPIGTFCEMLYKKDNKRLIKNDIVKKCINKNNSIKIFFSKECFKHIFVPEPCDHPYERNKLKNNIPENSTRLDVLISNKHGILNINTFAKFKVKCVDRKATVNDILRVHDVSYLKFIINKIKNFKMSDDDLMYFDDFLTKAKKNFKNYLLTNNGNENTGNQNNPIQKNEILQTFYLINKKSELENIMLIRMNNKFMGNRDLYIQNYLSNIHTPMHANLKDKPLVSLELKKILSDSDSEDNNNNDIENYEPEKYVYMENGIRMNILTDEGLTEAANVLYINNSILYNNNIFFNNNLLYNNNILMSEKNTDYPFFHNEDIVGTNKSATNLLIQEKLSSYNINVREKKKKKNKWNKDKIEKLLLVDNDTFVNKYSFNCALSASGVVLKAVDYVHKQKKIVNCGYEKLKKCKKCKYCKKCENCKKCKNSETCKNCKNCKKCEYCKKCKKYRIQNNSIIPNNRKKIFCVVRPPGHHLGTFGAAQFNLTDEDVAAGSQGFCILNNVAVGLAYAKYTYKKFERIAIIDFDVHHGNGTEQIIRNLGLKKLTVNEYIDIYSWKGWKDNNDKKNIFFSSVHAYDGYFYPGTGYDTVELEPYIINVTLKKNMTSLEFLNIFHSKILIHLYYFKPNLLFLSAGFDGHQLDYVNNGFVKKNTSTYFYLTKLVLSLQNKLNFPIISVLEGGYNTSKDMASVFSLSVLEHVLSFYYNDISFFRKKEIKLKDLKKNIERMERYKNDLKKYKNDLKKYKDDLKVFEDYLKENKNLFENYKNDLKKHRNDFKKHKNDLKIFKDDFKKYKDDFKIYCDFNNYYDLKKSCNYFSIYYDDFNKYYDNLNVHEHTNNNQTTLQSNTDKNNTSIETCNTNIIDKMKNKIKKSEKENKKIKETPTLYYPFICIGKKKIINMFERYFSVFKEKTEETQNLNLFYKLVEYNNFLKIYDLRNIDMKNKMNKFMQTHEAVLKNILLECNYDYSKIDPIILPSNCYFYELLNYLKIKGISMKPKTPTKLEKKFFSAINNPYDFNKIDLENCKR
ncbi:hypothetical protein PFNF54_05846 [Plasmodium falciparum NF54]|nr:hypothetical protein PFNF54_05846 [Plasmodium falciparum NF54]